MSLFQVPVHFKINQILLTSYKIYMFVDFPVYVAF